jgi:hypothetical protein
VREVRLCSTAASTYRTCSNSSDQKTFDKSKRLGQVEDAARLGRNLHTAVRYYSPLTIKGGIKSTKIGR